jgi:hypothetical protein
LVAIIPDLVKGRDCDEDYGFLLRPQPAPTRSYPAPIRPRPAPTRSYPAPIRPQPAATRLVESAGQGLL